MTVSDYCAGLTNQGITVNREYQRSDKVWPLIAQSFLIETVLLSYPVPKLSLHQVTDVISRKTVKQVVDGQQRSRALLNFYNDDLRLSRSIDYAPAAGKKYSQLSEELQGQFLNYSLSIDLFVGASQDDVREVFRRMNLYTVPLNYEEQRHAVYQGEFKWFVHRVTRDYDDVFARIGLFPQKQLVRMQDTKLITDICHAYLNGIKTTSRTDLDKLYQSRDRDFPEQSDLDEKVRGAIDELLTYTDIQKTALMKPLHAYALILALIHTKEPCPSLESAYPMEGRARDTFEGSSAALEALILALDNPDDTYEEYDQDYDEFVDASTARTNVKSQRETRFAWFCAALTVEA
ncbi:DUF262 domain-containing protein [Kribbella sp. NPDC050281]|uniref:DUF262 domain-containing protein n=1 Tax=Kribbella sp. NPDC050281 TaxID=3155515 RepID=UPI0033C97E88